MDDLNVEVAAPEVELLEEEEENQVCLFKKKLKKKKVNLSFGNILDTARTMFIKKSNLNCAKDL